MFKKKYWKLSYRLGEGIFLLIQYHLYDKGFISRIWVYAEYIMRNAGLDEAQTGIKIAGRNIKNLRYADDTTLMEEIKEELKSLLMKVKEESEKADLKVRKLRSWPLVPSLHGK